MNFTSLPVAPGAARTSVGCPSGAACLRRIPQCCQLARTTSSRPRRPRSRRSRTSRPCLHGNRRHLRRLVSFAGFLAVVLGTVVLALDGAVRFVPRRDAVAVRDAVLDAVLLEVCGQRGLARQRDKCRRDDCRQEAAKAASRQAGIRAARQRLRRERERCKDQC